MTPWASHPSERSLGKLEKERASQSAPDMPHWLAQGLYTSVPALYHQLAQPYDSGGGTERLAEVLRAWKIPSGVHLSLLLQVPTS